MKLTLWILGSYTLMVIAVVTISALAGCHINPPLIAADNANHCKQLGGAAAYGTSGQYLNCR